YGRNILDINRPKEAVLLIQGYSIGGPRARCGPDTANMFGSTYTCESSFSHVNAIKNVIGVP
ncbi:Hypothetical protein FKW44_015653, partial [Caligus rogercresseyi]